MWYKHYRRPWILNCLGVANQQGVFFIAYLTHICGILNMTTKIQMHVSASWAGSKIMNETERSAQNHASRLWVYYLQK